MRTHALPIGFWPDGKVCRTCVDRGLRLRGACPSCSQVRALPGLRPEDGTPICTSCAGFKPSYACSRCGQDSKLHARRLCTRCTFTDRLTDLLDDGSGRVRPELALLFERLTTMDNPLTGLTWLYKESTPVLLRGLADGTIPLDHEALHRLPNRQAVSHLRELLMACEVLPQIDKQICLFESWLAEHLATIRAPKRAQTIRRFATWAVLPRLRRAAELKPLNASSRSHAGNQIIRATEFMAWLSHRRLTLARCNQTHLDAWLADHAISDRQSLRAFLTWIKPTN